MDSLIFKDLFMKLKENTSLYFSLIALILSGSALIINNGNKIESKEFYMLSYDENGCDQFHKDRLGNSCSLEEGEIYIGTANNVKYFESSDGTFYSINLKNK